MTHKNLKSQKKSKALSKTKGSLGLRLVKVVSVNQGKLQFRLRFDDGITETVTLSSIFSIPKNLAAEVLKGNMLRQCFVENGALAWPNGLELCADKLRMLAKEGKRAA